MLDSNSLSWFLFLDEIVEEKIVVNFQKKKSKGFIESLCTVLSQIIFFFTLWVLIA